MEFTQQQTSQNSIVSMDELCVKLAHDTLKYPCFISPNYHTQVSMTNLSQLDKTILFPLSTQDDIDLLIIGTGISSQFLHPKQYADITQMGFGVETMNNRSACHSFNLLLSDVRRVGLLLL